MLSSGTTRGIVFCGLPRGEVDIVAAILDESGLPPCAIEVATGSNKDAKVVSDTKQCKTMPMLFRVGLTFCFPFVVRALGRGGVLDGFEAEEAAQGPEGIHFMEDSAREGPQHAP